ASKGSQLKVALLPILDVFPFYVAQKEGYFEEAGIDVKAVPVTSGLERDQLMQSGAIDGMLTEMTTTASFNRLQPLVRIVRVARVAYPKYPLFRLLSAPGSGLNAPRALSGVPIAVSMNTIIEYVTDRLLAAYGLKGKEIIKQSVPIIPERYHLLMQGQIKAAMLPDPLAKSALESGAGLVADDSTHTRLSASVLSFSVDTLTAKGDTVRRFLKAWDRAASRINEAPDTYRALLLKRIRVPKNIQKTYVIPPYPRNGVPDEEQWKDVIDWMIQKGLLKTNLPYRASVTKAFLP
ncbi:MAG: ABC transporter substrate-binding protein, partial [Deltaproteobacteria bacterium]|nr:ABC transporter substrate-binding protein [Deltaproteobacteria bacterium]